MMERQDEVSFSKAFKEYCKRDILITFKDFLQMTKRCAKDIGLTITRKGTICLRNKETSPEETRSGADKLKGKLRLRKNKKGAELDAEKFINENYEDIIESGV